MCRDSIVRIKYIHQISSPTFLPFPSIDSGEKCGIEFLFNVFIFCILASSIHSNWDPSLKFLLSTFVGVYDMLFV